MSIKTDNSLPKCSRPLNIIEGPHLKLTDEDDDPRQGDTGAISGRIVYPDDDGRNPDDEWHVQVFTLPESWATWGPEAAGDNTHAHAKGDRVRVQFLLDEDDQRLVRACKCWISDDRL